MLLCLPKTSRGIRAGFLWRPGAPWRTVVTEDLADVKEMVWRVCGRRVRGAVGGQEAGG